MRTRWRDSKRKYFNKRSAKLPLMSIVLRSDQARSAWDPMYIRQIVFAVVLVGTLVRFGPATAGDGFPAAEWERVTPAELGWSETELAQARSFSDQIRSSAVVIVQHGKVVAEWGNTTKPMELASIRKSVLSALIGIAVSDHLINPTAPLANSASTIIRLV